ncbi:MULTISPECIES: GNAT family N-acetyltransferase [Citrobacter]|uniref:GNAT family N-acetyltransferase n=1 Tax=Citrobacter TaxID=544 RepID=UPI0006A95CCC|nr:MULTISPECIES: GNAT family N-acetyltransferase [Citrobacter]MCZ5391803.1 GNAT family N-acetyltransferase [Citrobacter braakii]MDM3322970.1 GNAT family N-acetyltransferase [Citrobacter sp. Cb080]MDV0579708.1 GNAT family N-acetyltransferase [Citrobacter braakii]MEB0651412.1 GNAT family N-acetyltransferase [Citrobacter braakii]QLY03451.1 GNAT family N-acetyltransferase [Citrobacter sp. RHBSTW-00599]
MSLIIRQATLADSALLNELGYRFYTAHFKHMWKSESEFDNYLEGEYSLPVIEQSINDKNISWYIVEIEQPIGFVKLTWQATVPNTDISGVLLNKLYLAPTKTNQHYGQLMFNKVIDLARSQGKKYLWLEVLEQNERAQKFYKKQGMKHISDIIFETNSQRSILKLMGMCI